MTIKDSMTLPFSMTEKIWARHANPWSVWTGLIPPLWLPAAGWSRVWLGPWSLVLVAAGFVWIWLSVRVFPKPRTTDNWASKWMFGERVWSNRRRIPVPPHHRRVPHILNAISIVGAAIAVWAVTILAIWPAVLGTLLFYFGKLWFADRMVWLYEEMEDLSPEYRNWLH
jgi:hypothetical protein